MGREIPEPAGRDSRLSGAADREVRHAIRGGKDRATAADTGGDSSLSFAARLASETTAAASGRALAIANREYWEEKIRRGAAVRLGQTPDGGAGELQLALEPTLAARFEAATGGDREAQLIVGMAALAILAERYTCAAMPLLAAPGLETGDGP